MVYSERGIGDPPRGVRWFKTAQHWLLSGLLPARCIACGDHTSQSELIRPILVPPVLDLCRACHECLPVNHYACRHCGLPLSSTQPDLVCGRCLVRSPRYDLSFCAYHYGYPLQHLIRQLKYQAALSHAQVLGTLLALYLRDRHAADWPECFVPVPLHPSRYRRRGYNQVIEVGKVLQQLVPAPMRTDLVTRRRNTVEQAGLSRRARRSNLHRAFVTHGALPKHIAILDDVVTTGSTVNELSRVFKAAGVERIEIWGVARAVVGKVTK